MVDSSIVFNSTNFLPLPNSEKWIKSSGVSLDSDGNLKIPSGGSVYCDIQDIVNKQFHYYKIRMDVVCKGLSAESSLDSDISVCMKMNYIGANGKPTQSETCGMNMSTYDPVDIDAGEYRDVKIMNTYNLPIHSAIFQITNLTSTDLVVKEVKMYVSEDMSQSQIVDTVNNMIGNNRFIGAIFGTTPDKKKLKYIKAVTVGSPDAVTITPIYVGNELNGIELSNGTKIVCTYES